MAFTGELYQTFREELTPIFLKLLKKKKKKNCSRRNTFKLILWCHHHPDAKTKDITQERKLQANITDAKM